MVKTAASDQAKATKVVPTVKPNIPETFKNPIQVSNWDQFDATFRDKNVDQIVLNNDIDVTGGRNKVFDNRGISRTAEITSTENNRYTMNFGNHFMSLWDNAQNGSDQGWNIIIKNVDIKSTIGNNPVKISVGVKVTIVDLQGQPIVTHIDADTPDPTKGITGQPAGTTDIHWTQVPSTKTPGSTQGVVEVTYPDGTKSTATVPVTVIAPNVPDVIYVPKGDKVPDPSTVVTNSNDIKDKIPDTTYTWKTTPDTPNTKVVINYKANNPGTPDTPVTPPVDPGDNPATPVTPPVKPEQKPTTPTPHATKTPAKDNGGKKTVASEQKSTLPQTGKKDNVALTAIGVAIAAAGSLLGLADSKKHRS